MVRRAFWLVLLPCLLLAQIDLQKQTKGTLPVSKGGTGASTAEQARVNIGLGNVENVAISTWAGSSNITTLGTITSGTIPWARLSDVPSFESPLTFSSPLSRSTNTISCPNCIVSTGSYSDPDWLTISKSKVGLGNVENTALSTWTGSSNITTVGTITSGTIPWARLSDVPSSFTPSAHAANHAAGGSDPITSLGGVSFTSSIQVAGYVKAQKQISFKIYDDNTALPHKTYTDIWWPELGTVIVNSVSCKADTADAVIQFLGIMLADNTLTCGQATKNSTTNLIDATLTTSETLGVQLISGTAKSITVSLVVTQQ